MFRRSLGHYAGIFVTVLACSAITGREAAADDVKAQLDALRNSLEKYQDYTVAVRDLYLSTVGCVHYSGEKIEHHMEYPKGAMGIHFVNLTLKGPPNPSKPNC